MLAWTEQGKCTGLSEQPMDIWVVTKSCNIKLINGITWINVNHGSTKSQHKVNHKVAYTFLEYAIFSESLEIRYYQVK